MNYLTEIKGFYDMVQVKQLSTGQIALWHALMYINNKTGWNEWFSVPAITLQLLTGLSRSAINKNRNVLKQAELIDFKTNGERATTYKINSTLFIEKGKNVSKSNQDSNQNSNQGSNQDGNQDSSTLNKRNEMKLNETNKTLRVCDELPSSSPPPELAISLPLNDKSEYLIYSDNVKEWSELYQAVDVMSELRKMKGWLDSNPQKRKTKKGIKRFINSWLCREQDRGKALRGYNYGNEYSCSKNTRTEEIFNTDEFYRKQGLI